MPGFIRTGRFFVACLMFLLSSVVAWGDWKAPREALDNRRVQGEFRIYYTLEDVNAFPRNVPYSQRAEQVNNELDQLVYQLSQADRFYSSGLGLTPPLKSQRFRNAHSIDVQILDLGEDMGTMGDGIITYHYLNFDAAAPAITISLSNRWKPGNLTPNHELFHAYQYGYTYFKNSWFLEGMAHSMESAFKDVVPKSAPLPRNKIELQGLLSKSYGADTFWNRLMKLCDPACDPAITGSMGHPKICGGPFIRTLLDQYQAVGNIAAQDRGINPHDWPEAEQHSAKNNSYLILGLSRAIENQCPLGKNAELGRFDKLLKQVAVP